MKRIFKYRGKELSYEVCDVLSKFIDSTDVNDVDDLFLERVHSMVSSRLDSMESGVKHARTTLGEIQNLVGGSHGT